MSLLTTIFIFLVLGCIISTIIVYLKAFSNL